MTGVRFHEGPAIRSLGLHLPQMCFVFSPDYLSAVAQRRGGRAGVFEINLATGRCFVPAVLFRRAFLKLMTIQAPPSRDTGRPLELAEEAAALEALAGYLRRSGLAHRLTQPANWSLFQGHPQGAVATPFGSYVLPLGAGSEALWKGLHQKNRNVIRSAEAGGVIVREGPEQFETCFSIYRATMLRNGMSHEPRDFLEALMASDDFKVYCGVAYAGGHAACALFAPNNAYGAYYLFGGTSEEIGINGANNLLHFEAIRAFAAQGVGFYDFVGARVGKVVDPRLEGIQRFKSRFGGELRHGLLWKQDTSSLHCRAFDILSGLRNLAAGRSRSLDIIDQERIASASGAE